MKFDFSIGGYFDSQFRVVLKDDELHFFISQFPFSIEMEEPTHIVFIKKDILCNDLIQFLNNIKWKRKYESEILDGTQWILVFENHNKVMKCYGNNSFPEEFENFINLIKKIMVKHNISNDVL